MLGKVFLCSLITASWCVAIGLGDTTVDLLDLWGTLSVRAGETPVAIKCAVKTDNPDGEFLWTVGGAPLRRDTKKEDIGDGSFRLTYSYQPKIEDDGKELKCKYVERDQNGAIVNETEDGVDIDVSLAKFPPTVVNSGEYSVGQQVDLEVVFEMYPPPRPDEITWAVTDAQGENEIKIQPGESKDGYSVLEIEDLGDHKYVTTLRIAEASEAEVSKTHELMVEINEVDKKVPVTFTFAKEAVPGSSPTPPSGTDEPAEETNKPPYEVETTTPADKKESKLGVGLFIIIAIIVLIVLVCVGYCVYQRCCRNKSSGGAAQPRSTEIKRQEYALTATDDKNPA